MNINQLRLKNKKKYLIVNSDKFKTEDDFLDAIAQKLNEYAFVFMLFILYF